MSFNGDLIYRFLWSGSVHSTLPSEPVCSPGMRMGRY